MTSVTPDVDQEIEAFIRQAFEQNYEELRLDTGHAVTPDVKETALQQVLFYWRKLQEVAKNITDTEVRLSLPGQETPRGREYSIEGIVDIVRANDRTVMYDIKTHNADYVRANVELYEQQLNVYAYIWQELRRQPLDEMAVIATDYPESVQDALYHQDERELARALEEWDPLVPIEFDRLRVEQTIREFGAVVDAIEDGRFSPPPLERLNEVTPGARQTRFGTYVCVNCDARFSCVSYRQYAWASPRIAERSAIQYYTESLNDAEQDNWRSANLDATPNATSLRADFGTRT